MGAGNANIRAAARRVEAVSRGPVGGHNGDQYGGRGEGSGEDQMAGVNRLMISNRGAVSRVHAPVIRSTPMTMSNPPLTPANTP